MSLRLLLLTSLRLIDLTINVVTLRHNRIHTLIQSKICGKPRKWAIKLIFFVLFEEIKPTVRVNFHLQIERLKFTRGTNFLLGEHFSLQVLLKSGVKRLDMLKQLEQ